MPPPRLSPSTALAGEGWGGGRDSLFSPFDAAATDRPDHPALVIDGTPISYGTLLESALRVGAGVAALPRLSGIPPRLALRLGNCAEFLPLFLGTVAAGGTVALLDPKWNGDQLAAALEIVRPALAFATRDDAAAWIARQPAGWTAPPVDPRTPFLIGFTSGTTGRPKAFIRDQGSWLATLAASRVEFAIGPDDGVLVPGPLVHGLGLYGAVEGLAAGAIVHVQPKFDAADAIGRLERHKLTTLVAVPTMLVGMLEAAGDRTLPGVTRIVSSGAKLSPAVHDRLSAVFPNATVLEYYGASELSFVSLRSSREGAPEDSVGRPFHGVELSLRDEAGIPVPQGSVGTVWVRSAMLSDGYIGPSDGSGFRAQDGWGTVGDRGWLDEAGWLRLIGREGDMLISGGLNVYPTEVEAALRSHPAVAEAVVLGLPDPYWGDAVAAVLWWRGDARATAADLRDRCHRLLEGYKAPRRFFIAADMPLTTSGKIARSTVRERAAAGALEELP